MLFIVKNTTHCGLTDLVCPHICRGCGALGEILCSCCKKDILDDYTNFCPVCKRENPNGNCEFCNLLPPTFMLGWRDELVGKMVQQFKYHSTHAMGEVFAELLENVLPTFIDSVVIVPLPTAHKHVRERGLDHTLLIARKLARKRGWTVSTQLRRRKDTVQVGATMKQRILQAARAYEFTGKINPNCVYLLLDDVWTTGSSLRAALKKLQQAGASKIMIAVLAVNRVGQK